MGVLPVISLFTYASLMGRTNSLQTNLSKQSIVAQGLPPIPKDPCLHKDKAVDCVNPRDERQCRIGASKRPAITFTFDSHTEWTFNETWYMSMKSVADKMNASLVLLLPAKTAHHEEKKACSALAILLGACTPSPPFVHIPKDQLKEIQKYFKIVRVPWVVPPNLGKGVPREGGGCGAREFMKLHALSLVEYDAVINLDTDVTIHGSLKPLFDCAASGLFLTARNSYSPVSGAFFATKPSKGLLYDMLMELTMSTANEKEGWNGRGVAPGLSLNQASFQGFMYYYLHQHGVNQKDIKAGQVNPCHWTGAEYCEIKSCDHLPLRHKLSCPKAYVEFISTEARMTERIFNNASLVNGFVAAESSATDDMEFGHTLSWLGSSDSDAFESVNDEFGPRLIESEIAAFLLSKHEYNKTVGNILLESNRSLSSVPLKSNTSLSNISLESNTSEGNGSAKDVALFDAENSTKGELASTDDDNASSEVSPEEDDHGSSEEEGNGASSEDGDGSLADMSIVAQDRVSIDGEEEDSSSEDDSASSEDDPFFSTDKVEENERSTSEDADASFADESEGEESISSEEKIPSLKDDQILSQSNDVEGERATSEEDSASLADDVFRPQTSALFEDKNVTSEDGSALEEGDPIRSPVAEHTVTEELLGSDGDGSYEATSLDTINSS